MELSFDEAQGEDIESPDIEYSSSEDPLHVKLLTDDCSILRPGTSDSWSISKKSTSPSCMADLGFNARRREDIDAACLIFILSQSAAPLQCPGQSYQDDIRSHLVVYSGSHISGFLLKGRSGDIVIDSGRLPYMIYQWVTAYPQAYVTQNTFARSTEQIFKGDGAGGAPSYSLSVLIAFKSKNSSTEESPGLRKWDKQITMYTISMQISEQWQPYLSCLGMKTWFSLRDFLRYYSFFVST